MDKIISLLKLDVLKGIRTKLTIIIGIGLTAALYTGHITTEQYSIIMKFLALIGLHFAVSHFEPKQ